MNDSNPLNSAHLPILRKTIYGLAILLAVLIIFQAGMSVGYRRATFLYHWDTSYSSGLGNPHSILAPFARDADDMNPNSVIGNLVSVHMPLIMVKGPSSAERVVLLSSSTIIRYSGQDVSISNLSNGNQVLVIGAPDDQGQIRASFIRILATSTIR